MQFRHYHRFPRLRPHAGSVSYTPKQLAGFYGLPTNSTIGAGKSVAVIELGGGFDQAVLDAYFKSLGYPSVAPVIFHSVSEVQNQPDDPAGDHVEVMLDLCVIGGTAPGAKMHCYVAPNTDVGFLDAINQAVADKMDAISISWGGPEDQWPAATLTAFNTAFQRAAAAGITVTAASGDNGSSDGESGPHVDFPASSPYVTGCGGTTLPTLSAGAEAVWNDGIQGGATGGGVSALFQIPAFQAKAGVPGNVHRGVPDIAGCADPNTGWLVAVDNGSPAVTVGGTSAVAPLVAAISLYLSQVAGKRIGQLAGLLYQLPAGCLRDVTSGNNGTYVAKVGYDCCTGQGVPVAIKLAAALATPAPAPAPAPTPPPPKPPTPTTRTIVVTGSGLSVTVDGKTA